jgi:hypothetical protein
MIYTLNPSKHNKEAYVSICSWMSKHPTGLFSMSIKCEYSQISDVLINKKVKQAVINAKPQATTLNPFTNLVMEIEKHIQELGFGQLLVSVTLINGIPQMKTLDITMQKHYKFRIDRPGRTPKT